MGNPLGKYTLKETYFPLGYYTEDKEYSIDLSYSEEEPLKVLYEQKVGIANKKTVTEITKSDVTTEEELEGAKLTVTDENGKTIDTWVSTNEKHVIKGLEVGKTYTLIEDYAPLGYLTANSIEFTVKDNFEVTKVVMHDDFTKWEFTKVDEQGDQLKGATLQVIKIADNSKDNDENSNANVDEDESSDENSQESVKEDKDSSEEDKDGSEEDLSYIQEPAKVGTVVDEWVTDGTLHRTDKLEIGSTYVLREKSAPKGYEVADDLEFTVEATPEIQKLKMTDKKIPEVPTSASSNLPFIIGGGVLLVVLLGIVLIVLKRR